MITHEPSDGSVPIVAGESVADIYVDGDDHEVATIAATDLGDDIERVTGRRPAVTDSLAELSETAVIVGTIGRSAGVERCLQASDVSAAALTDERESFVVGTVDEPLPGLESCVLIAGSDRRGTAYGAYELSKRIGVSPWYWWADVPTPDRDALYATEGFERAGPPSVRYRGVFINDEDFGFREWAQQTHDPATPDGIGPTTYERLFELLLRLRANTIWPAMHEGTTAFYRCAGNLEAAERYGIVVGTSHCEPMHRNNVDEWDPETDGEWNYATNAERIREYWTDRVAEIASQENLFTVGMRGIHDSGMPGGDTLEERVDLLQRVIDDQREILGEHHESPVETVPQLFCPYKETLELYRNGLEVPEDVCLVWPDDNFGYLRRLPTGEERARSGGHGVYYHLSYWGRPYDHQWLCSVPPALIREELHRAYRHGVDTLWMANVGDLKPAETETEYFFELAWDVDGVAERSTSDWLAEWAARKFGSAYADEIADVLAEYYRLALARKPEHVGWNAVYPNTEKNEPTFSAVDHGDEARRRLEAYERIDEAAAVIHEELLEEYRTAFFHLVEYQIRCARAMNEGALEAMRSRLYAGQGRTSTAAYADQSRAALDRIDAATERYNASSNGKWREMMSASPRDLPVFDQPATGRVTDEQGPTLEIAVEGTAGVAGTGPRTRRLPTIVQGVDRPRFVDCYNRGGGAIAWTATAADDWIDLERTSGTFETDKRLWVGVDWDAAPDSRTTGRIRIAGAGRELEVAVPIRPRERPTAGGVDGDSEPGPDRTPLFVESNGRVAIEADHPTAIWQAKTRWEPVDGLSRTTGTAMASQPVDGLRVDADAVCERAARLEYDFEADADDVRVEVQLLPTHAPTESTPHRYAVAIDGAAPTVVDFDANGGEHDPQWQRNVLRSSVRSTTDHELDQGGRHTLSLYAMDPSVVVDRAVIYTDDDSRRSYLGPRETRDQRLE
ncbi:glycosyl hydrolase 115 family protein (plasmid) [Haloterrigena salifodinae]|uniref:Glycosyl hydrolase 115 family protein n=1 Tax=Haloterrigena salifodinae TaxID=2675099 RepID=A0A8T8E8B3_9EURY|nr:glycosyl hydrolase 115 family protein [Haloterrigena salifodinae]QRV17780.1 glycosyl hydrolase 115 family protein [Haloterrigena salifodinae]